ncbi:hypothetical protein U91I_00085 [alpha proteobacterium U9-1i]|nr:hypothetical protein U91I_00085 [alpha proteobacterium U9-1i]
MKRHGVLLCHRTLTKRGPRQWPRSVCAALAFLSKIKMSGCAMARRPRIAHLGAKL